MKILSRLAVLSMVFAAACESGPTNAQSKKEPFTNHLAGESSPYLLQHAHNPVDWFPWGEEALAKAEKENKMLIISVGYSACHWCHVMEEESFSDTSIARLMNENFVNIKVDREERPDIDGIYMKACQLASEGACGWPLNSFALPDGRPVWAGTYFPKQNWVDILNYFIEVKEKEPAKLEEYATMLTQRVKLSGVPAFHESDKIFSRKGMENVIREFLQEVDMKMGGARKGAPKFPIPANWEMLLAWHHFADDEKTWKAVEVTLDAMAKGGIYDHLGGGFARYSTDENWHIPHFEKMLYDNAQLVSLYSQAYQANRKPLYKEVVGETLEFVKLNMTSPEGGFYSSIDADSEGEEGKFYAWTLGEIRQVLNDDRLLQVVTRFYNLSEKGNWEGGKNIFFRKENELDILNELKISKSALDSLLLTAKQRLLKARSLRIPPATDDKILFSWNAMMIKGYCDAYRAFGEEKFREVALTGGNFLVNRLMSADGRILRSYLEGKSSVDGFLDDYAFGAASFIALYEITFDEKWLSKAKELADYAVGHFRDQRTGLFFYTSDEDEALVARLMETEDNVIPSSNSEVANVLYTLGHYFYENEYLEMAEHMLASMQARLQKENAGFYSNWWMLWLHQLRPPYEVVIAGPEADAFRKQLSAHYLPHVLLLGGKKEGSLELMQGKVSGSETRIFVCKNKVCKLPVTEVEKASKLLEE